MIERWLPVVGYEGRYEVSDFGRVRSLIKAGLIKKQVLNPCGYLYTMLAGRKNFRTHKLVLEAFVGPYPKGKEARHLDGNRTNNMLKNLCYGTWYENLQDRRRHETDTVGERHPCAKLSEVDAVDILWLSGWGVKDRPIAEMYGVNTESVRRIRVGQRWAHLH